jgi:hypothetical protein
VPPFSCDPNKFFDFFGLHHKKVLLMINKTKTKKKKKQPPSSPTPSFGVLESLHLASVKAWLAYKE